MGYRCTLVPRPPFPVPGISNIPQTKLVVNAHMDEIINLTPVKGNSYDKVGDFYEKFRPLANPGGGRHVERVRDDVTCDHTLPPLYSDAVKEGMIHLLVGSYVKKPDSGVFSDWSRNNAYETLHSYWLSYFNLISGQKVGLARRKQNGGDRARF